MITSNLKNLVLRRNALNAELEKIRRDLESAEHQLKGAVRERLDAFSPNLEAYVLLYSETPMVSIQPYFDNEKEMTFVKIEGQWMWCSGYVCGRAYRHEVITRNAPPAPFCVEEFEALCTAMAEEFEIPVEISGSTFVVVNPDQLRTTKDLLEVFPGSEILASGEIMSLGWDIPDYWAILQDGEGKAHVFYSTNGHGHGFDVHIKPGESPDSFVELTHQQGFDRGSWAREVLRFSAGVTSSKKEN